MIRPFAATVMVVTLATTMAATLTGCGGNGGSTTTPSSSTPKVTALQPLAYTFPPTFSAQSQQDTASSIAISMTNNDLPSTWTATYPPSSTEPRPEIIDEHLVNCLFGAKPSDLTSYIVSSNYISGDNKLTATSYVRTVGNKAAASRDFGNFTADRIEKCQYAMYDIERTPPTGVDARDLFFRKYGTAVPPTKMPVDKISLGTQLKDVLAFHMVVAPTDTASTYQDIFAYGAGRYETVIIFEGPSQADNNVEFSIVAKLQNRTLAAALRG